MIPFRFVSRLGRLACIVGLLAVLTFPARAQNIITTVYPQLIDITHYTSIPQLDKIDYTIGRAADGTHFNISITYSLDMHITYHTNNGDIDANAYGLVKESGVNIPSGSTLSEQTAGILYIVELNALAPGSWNSADYFYTLNVTNQTPPPYIVICEPPISFGYYHYQP